MRHSLSLGFSLLILWLLLSGHGEAWLIALGLASSALVVFIALRMETIDHEGHPLHIAWRGLTYWPWLLKEIFVSALQVSRIILGPTLKIEPHLVRLRASQKDDLGRSIYANSITLTPGTVTIDLKNGGDLVVHALTGSGSKALKEGDMDRKVSKLMGEA